MSGLEIVGTVVGIVSAITAVAKAIQKARDKRKSALQASTQKLETQLIATLDNGPPRINNEYNSDLARIGPSFSRGDAIANGQLVTILVDVNASLVNVINSFVAAGKFTFTASNYETWNRAGSKTTEDTVTTLAQLYQRQLQAARLPLNLPSPTASRIEEVEDVEWTYSNGSSYKGEVVNGKRHGHGTEKWADGGSYEGNWCRNKKEGYGKHVWADGARYTGEWKADLFHGHGFYVMKDGDTYNGEWVNHVQHGYGVYTHADGTVRRGQWKNGQVWNE